MSSTNDAAQDAPPDEAGRLAGRWTAASRLALPAAILAAIVGVLVATSRYGIGLTPDSVTYVTGARGIADGRGYTDAFDSAIGLFPPGYSAVLALGEWLGIGVLDAARGLSALSFGFTVFLAWVLLGRHVRSPGVRAAATILVGCSAVLLEIYSKLLSEHLFVPVVLLFILVCEELLDRPRYSGWFAGAVALAWAGFYLRYVGLVLILVGGLVLVVAGWSKGRVAAVARAAVFGVASISVPAIWMLRNQDAKGDPLGPRAESSVTVLGNLRRVADEVGEWIATRLVPSALHLVVLAVVVVALLAIIVWWWRRATPVPPDWKTMLPTTLLIVVYVVYLVGSATVVAFAAIDTRFMVPVYVPLVVLGAWGFERIRAVLPSPRLRTVVTVLGVLWIVANGLWFAGRAVGYARNGAGGYATERFHDSRILREVDRLDLADLTYSNDPFAISVLLDKEVRLSVAARYFNSQSKTTQLPQFLETISCAGHAQLIWLEPNMRTYLYTPEELQRDLILDPIDERDDGVVYDIRPRPGVTPECRE